MHLLSLFSRLYLQVQKNERASCHVPKSDGDSENATNVGWGLKRLSARPHVRPSIDLGLVARAVLDTLRLELLLDIFGNAALHGDRIHPAHVFI
jgi:hypothetical protein